MTCSAIDITPLKEAARELERLDRLKTQLLGMAAHDLRNPISSIIAVTDFLYSEAGPVLREEHLGLLSAIRSSSEFMLQLIDDSLDLSTIESGICNCTAAGWIRGDCSNTALLSTPSWRGRSMFTLLFKS